MIFLGIDVGKTGGISRHAPDGVSAFKFTGCTPTDLFKLIEQVSKGSNPVAMVERVHSMPKNSGKSMFTFGTYYGYIIMALVALKIPFEYVSPAKWQGFLSCRSGGDKNITKQKAQELYPNLNITHATADAILIGEYLKRNYYKNLEL